MDNFWGFVDGTVRPISGPGQNQRVLYNGHKRVHAIKFQSVVSPNGLICFPHKGLDTMQECCECPVSWRLVLVLEVTSRKFTVFLFASMVIITAPPRVERSLNLFYSSSRSIYIYIYIYKCGRGVYLGIKCSMLW